MTEKYRQLSRQRERAFGESPCVKALLVAPELFGGNAEASVRVKDVECEAHASNSGGTAMISRPEIFLRTIFCVFLCLEEENERTIKGL